MFTLYMIIIYYYKHFHEDLRAYQCWKVHQQSKQENPLNTRILSTCVYLLSEKKIKVLSIFRVGVRKSDGAREAWRDLICKTTIFFLQMIYFVDSFDVSWRRLPRIIRIRTMGANLKIIYFLWRRIRHVLSNTHNIIMIIIL